MLQNHRIEFRDEFRITRFSTQWFFLVIRVPVFDNESHSMKSISYNRATDIQYSMSWSPWCLLIENYNKCRYSTMKRIIEYRYSTEYNTDLIEWKIDSKLDSKSKLDWKKFEPRFLIWKYRLHAPVLPVQYNRQFLKYWHLKYIIRWFYNHYK